MKKYYIVLISFLIIGCNTTPKSELILGNWKLVSMTDLKTMEIETSEGKEESINVSITSDSIAIGTENEKDDTYGWSILGDSLNLTSDRDTVAHIYLKTLNKEILEVELTVFFQDSTRMVFERIKAANTK